MQRAFNTLTAFALDPFARLAAAGDVRGALVASGLTTDEIEVAMSSRLCDAESAANGSFSSCETCIDPGGDPDSFD